MYKVLIVFGLIMMSVGFARIANAQSCNSFFNDKPNKILQAIDAAKSSVPVMHTEHGLGMVLFLKKEEGSVIYISKGGTAVENVSFDKIYLILPKTVTRSEDVQEGIDFKFEGATFRTVGQFADGSLIAEHQSGFSFLKRIDIKNLKPGVLALSKDIHIGDKVLFVSRESRTSEQITAHVLSVEGIYAKVSFDKENSGFVNPSNPVESVTELIPLSAIVEILETDFKNPNLL